jgi:hypothetical protein
MWPQYKTTLQMLLYSLFVFGSLTLGLWSMRGRTSFWIGALLTFVLHGLVLYAIRSTFPFGSVFVVIPIALVEACAMYLLMLKVVGPGQAERPQ